MKEKWINIKIWAKERCILNYRKCSKPFRKKTNAKKYELPCYKSTKIRNQNAFWSGETYNGRKGVSKLMLTTTEPKCAKKEHFQWHNTFTTTVHVWENIKKNERNTLAQKINYNTITKTERRTQKVKIWKNTQKILNTHPMRAQKYF